MDETKIVETLSRQSEQLKTLFNRMDNLEKLTESVQKMAISLERLTARQSATEEHITALTGDVDELRQKPAKRWDAVVAAVISALVGAGIALLLK